MTKIIKLDSIQKNTKKFYELCSDISILQKELEDMLASIEKNSKDFENGKISKDLFKYNDNRMKRESAKAIKKINNSVNLGMSVFGNIAKEVDSQRMEGKVKKKSKTVDVKKKIKIKRSESKPRKKTESKSAVVETPKIETQAPAPEQSTQQGS